MQCIIFMLPQSKNIKICSLVNWSVFSFAIIQQCVGGETLKKVFVRGYDGNYPIVECFHLDNLSWLYWEFSHSKFFSWKICQKIYFSFFSIFFAHNKLFLASDLHIYDGTVTVLLGIISYVFVCVCVIYQDILP